LRLYDTLLRFSNNVWEHKMMKIIIQNLHHPHGDGDAGESKSMSASGVAAA